MSVEPLAARAERPPHPALAGLVTVTGYRHVMPAPGVHHGLPSGELTAILALDEPIDVAWARGDPQRGRHAAMVSGLHAVPALISYDRLQHGLQLAFTPAGSRALLGVQAGALAGCLVSWSALWGGVADQLYDEVAAADAWNARFDAVERRLLSRLERGAGAGVAPELAHAWSLTRRTRGTIRVGALAEEVGWSRHRLTVRFTDEFGVGPKQAARIERFQRARRLLEGDRPIAEIADRCGYADQAHLNRDFRDLGGVTPTQWRHETRAFVQDGVPAH